MKVIVRTRLEASAERVWSELKTSRLLTYVTAPLQKFVPVKPPALPEIWSEGDYQVKLLSFGVLPTGKQTISISYPESDPLRPNILRLRDNGSGDLARVWDHMITLEPLSSSQCLYEDSVEVKAGLLTPFIWGYAWMFYHWRQMRWRRLVAANFDYSAV